MRPRLRRIPVLLLSHKGLVKTKQFKHSDYLGDPCNAVRILNEKGVDELIILDIDKCEEDTGPDLKLISRISAEAFVPVTYGGGIRTLAHAQEVLSQGIEKISINRAVFTNPSILEQIAGVFGAQSVVVSLDVLKIHRDRYVVWTKDKSGQTNSIFLEDYFEKLNQDCIGELLVTSIDREGTLTGYDQELIVQVSKLARVPFTINGGAKSNTDLLEAWNLGADAAAASSLFFFYGQKRGVLITYPKLGDLWRESE